jgi:hypothetical protein
MTTKILALTDALGNLVRFVLLPGQRFDIARVVPLIEGLELAPSICAAEVEAIHAVWAEHPDGYAEAATPVISAQV